MRLMVLFLMAALSSFGARAAAPEDPFKQGNDCFVSGKFPEAATMFEAAVAAFPSSGAYLNLGKARWEQGLAGPAILAWERAGWIEPWLESARNELQFARKAAQIEGPDLAWFEVVSSWMPADLWAWMTMLSFWTLLGIVSLSGVFRWRRSGSLQALAALALTTLLLSVPAQIGIHTRLKIGFVTERDTPLRLTPTSEGQVISRLPSGEPLRLERRRLGYALVRTNHSRGWLREETFGLVCPVTKKS